MSFVVQKAIFVKDVNIIQEFTDSMQLIPSVLNPCKNVVVCERFISEIRNKLLKNKYLFISGIAGSGKSELTRLFCSKNKDLFNSNICMMNYSGDLASTIAQGVHFKSLKRNNFEMQKKIDGFSMQECFMYKLSLLKSIEAPLIIIDNFNNIEDENLGLLLKSNAYILIITKEDELDEFEAFYLDTMPEEELENLFDLNFPSNSCSSLVKKKLFEALSWHTMSIILAARLLRIQKILPITLLDVLNANRLCGISEKIKNVKDGNMKVQTIEQHLITLIDMTNLSEGQKKIILNISFSYPYSYSKEEMCELFEDLLNLEYLCEIGLIDILDAMIIIHPLISKIVKATIIPTDKNCKNSACYLLGKYKDGQLTRDCVITLGENISFYFNTMTEYKDLLEDASLCLYLQAYYSRSINILNVLKKKADTDLQKNDYTYKLILRYKYTGEYDTAIKLINQLLACYNAYDLNERKQIALVYIAQANIYHLKGSNLDIENVDSQIYFDDALNIYKKALKICKTAQGSVSITAAGIYDNIALMYSLLNMPPKAFTNSKKARKIFRKISGESSKDMAICYTNLGEIYKTLKCNEKALQNHLKSYEMKKKVLEESHDSIAVSCINIARIYIEMNDKINANRFLYEARNIVELKFLPSHVYSKYIFQGFDDVRELT